MVFRSFVTGTLAVLIATAVPAMVDKVTNLRFDGSDALVWDTHPGNVYHVYRGGLAALLDYGECHIGSIPGGNAVVAEDPAPDEAFFYLVTEADLITESTAGKATDLTVRDPDPRCILARRHFDPVADGNQGDGVVDGDNPLRNPSTMARHTKRETAGVFLHTGEFFYIATGLRIPGRHLDWSFRRTYRSQVDHDGMMGHNWDSNLNARLRPLGTDVLFYDGSGREERYFRVDMTRFTSPRGRYAVLMEHADFSFTLREPQGVLWNFHAFDESNVQGALESIEDRFGDLITFAYDHQGLLTTITDGLGRAISFDYDDAGRLTTVTDFAGRSWAYGYDVEGDMVTARSPLVTGTPNGNDFTAGKITSYSYSSGSPDARLNHCMLTVTNPNEHGGGPPWIQTLYFTGGAPAFDQGRVDTWTIGGTNASGIPAGGTIDFSYASLNSGAPPDETTARRQTTVIDRNGNLREYVHNHAGNRIEQTLFTNRSVRPAEPDYTTVYAYNSDGELVQNNFPDGNEAQYVYDSPGLDRYREGNLLEVRRIADTATGGGRGDGHGGESNDLVRTYQYENVFNQATSVVRPRGNDASYVPQNGGLQSADRYRTEWTYCHQEGDPATNGLDAYALLFDIDLTGFVSNLGDVNSDGETQRIFGNPIRVVLPEVALDPSSNQAAIEGDTSQDSVILHIYSPFAQRTGTTDPEGNVHVFEYHPENDPDGDGTPTPAPPDGRTLSSINGGYLAARHFDTAVGAARNNGTDPTPADVETSFTYDDVGNVTHVVDGRGVLTRMVRNSLNQVVELRRAAATADTAGPDGDAATGRGETGLVAPSFKVNLEFDANNNLVARRWEDRNQDHGAGTTADECLIWDIDDGSTYSDTEDQTGSTLGTSFRYDPNRNLIEIIQPEGNTHTFTYDELDRLHTTTTGATGSRGGAPVTRTYDYDGNGNVTRMTDGRGHLIDREYDGHDRRTRVIDQVGDRLEHFYDPDGHVVRALDSGPIGGPTPTDRSGLTNVDLRDVDYRWDEQQRLFRIDQALFVPSGATPGRTPVINEGPAILGDGAINTQFEYDRNGRGSFTVRDTTAVTRTDYDGLGRVITRTAPDGSTVETTWDAQHNVIETAETELSSIIGPAAELFLTTHFYDALGRRLQIIDNLGQTTGYDYSSLDAVIGISDANGPLGPTINRRSSAYSVMTAQTNLHGNVTRHDWDAADRLLRVDRILTTSSLGDGTFSPAPITGDPNNTDGLISMIYDWDDNSLKTTSQDDKLNTTSFAYDNLNRLVSRTNDDGTLSSYSYDLESNVLAQTDPNGNVMTRTWDAANRMTQLSANRAGGVVGTTTQNFEYDGLGRTTSTTDNNNPLDTSDDAEVQRIYDSLSRILEEKQIYGSAAGAEKLVDVRWTGDALIDELVYPSGRQIQYTYDAVDRLSSIGDSSRSETASYEWFGMGRLQTRTYGNGVRKTMLDDTGNVDTGYDGMRRVMRMRHLDGSNTLLAGFEHSYDRANNRGHELRLHDEDVGAGGFRGELWSFDSANRLTDFQEGVLDAGLSLIGSASDAQSWALDGVSNWVQMTRNGTTYNFTPNNLNEYDDPQSGGTRIDDGVPDDAYDDDGTPTADGQNRAHDKNGNRIDDDTLAYGFDFKNRLVSIVNATSGAPIAEYDYDAFDRRVCRQVTNSGDLNETRRYLYTPMSPGGGITGGGGSLSNCADDAIDTCNAKHPDPGSSDHAQELYELCIKAQIGQKCP